jgi:hypothetical protein
LKCLLARLLSSFPQSSNRRFLLGATPTQTHQLVNSSLCQNIPCLRLVAFHCRLKPLCRFQVPFVILY